MKKGNSVLATVMARTGATVEQIAEKIYGPGETPEQTAKNIDAINAILNYNEVGKNKVKAAVKAAGGTDDEIEMAGLIVSSDEFRTGKEELDVQAKNGLAEAVENFWNEFDEKSYKPFYESQFARGQQLLDEHKAAKKKEAEKAAKKAAAAADTAVEGEAPVTETPTDDPFDN